MRSDGRPHVTTLIAMWNGDALYFSEVTPVRALGFRKGFGKDGQGCQTRWRWERS